MQPDFKANVVCVPCNTGWMSDIETTAQPYLTSMIQGRRRTLYHEGKAACVVWALKTALMLSCVGPKAQRLFADDDYKRFYAAPGPFPDLYVWIGASAHGRGFFGEDGEQTIGSARGVSQGHRITLRFGHLVFHMLRVEFGDRPPPEVGGQLADALIRLWPSEDAVKWPPPVILSGPDAESVGRTIKGFN
jgi:hypothetical protein